MFRQNRKKSIRGVVRQGRYVVLPAQGRRVVRCEGWTIECDDDAGTTITITQPFRATWGESNEHLLVDVPRASLAGWFEILEGTTIRECRADDAGHLLLQFSSGLRIEVPASTFEAWECRNAKLLHAVSVAGGGLAIWGEQGSSAATRFC